MKKKRIFLQTFLAVIFIGLSTAQGQSGNIENPTPISSNTIFGKINARDIGDPRPTVHYYIFAGNQGDIFLKIECNNFNGDIDIFYADNLRPLTKINLYAESSTVQTGREIYLRKAERLILKVEGRTPIDDPATYSIRFDGSFQALAPVKNKEIENMPVVESDNESTVKVNSVGTIIEKPEKPAAANRTKSTSPRKSKNIEDSTSQTVADAKTSMPKNETDELTEDKKENLEDKPKVIVEEKVMEDSGKPEESAKAEPKSRKSRAKARTKRSTTPQTETLPKTKAAQVAEALEKINLIIEFKDGTKIERPMNEVVRFGVDRGVLTIVNKNGSIGRYSILEVVKVSIE